MILKDVSGAKGFRALDLKIRIGLNNSGGGRDVESLLKFCFL
jgi:hypothetical protein